MAEVTESYKAFIANSNLHMWGLNDGVRLFIRCAVDANKVRGEDWPRATINDKQWTVNCGMWIQNEDTTFRLVALWGSLGEGLTKLFSVAAFKESASMILDLTGGGEAGPAGENQLVDPKCYDAFLCLLGEEVVESFGCPVLEEGSPVEVKEPAV